MNKPFEDMIELMHTYWGEGDEVHKDLDELLELHKQELKQLKAEIFEIVAELESCCIDHEEDDIGQWTSFTFNYDKWADVVMELEHFKENKDE